VNQISGKEGMSASPLSAPVPNTCYLGPAAGCTTQAECRSVDVTVTVVCNHTALLANQTQANATAIITRWPLENNLNVRYMAHVLHTEI